MQSTHGLHAADPQRLVTQPSSFNKVKTPPVSHFASFKCNVGAATSRNEARRLRRDSHSFRAIPGGERLVHHGQDGERHLHGVGAADDDGGDRRRMLLRGGGLYNNF